jgi:hypothetical protein
MCVAYGCLLFSAYYHVWPLIAVCWYGVWVCGYLRQWTEYLRSRPSPTVGRSEHFRVMLDVVTALKMSVLFPWVVTPCGPVNRHRRFGEALYLRLQLRRHPSTRRYTSKTNIHKEFPSRLHARSAIESTQPALWWETWVSFLGYKVAGAWILPPFNSEV